MFFGDDYNAGLWPALNVDRQLISQTVDGLGANRVIRREHILSPQRELPGFMKKFVSGALTYRETNVFTAQDNRMEVVAIPNVLPDKIILRGTYRLERLGKERVRRIFEGECTCHIPLVGKKIEQQIVGEVEDSYRRTTSFTRDWIARHR